MKISPWGKCITITVGIVAALNLLGIRLAVTQGPSMEPSLHDRQIVLMVPDRDPQAGEILLFRTDGVGVLVKRLAGVPGDRILICDGCLYRNGTKVDTCGGTFAYAGIAGEEILLGEDEYFFLSDNPSHGTDSRYENIGIINRKYILGKALVP